MDIVYYKGKWWETKDLGLLSRTYTVDDHGRLWCESTLFGGPISVSLDKRILLSHTDQTVEVSFQGGLINELVRDKEAM